MSSSANAGRRSPIDSPVIRLTTPWDCTTNEPFLFGTIYDALWDAAVVRIGTLWDNSKGVASLPKLARQMERLGGSEAIAVARQIGGEPSPEWKRLKEWRHAIVAHAKFPLDPAAFDREFSINIADLRTEGDRIEAFLAEAQRALGGSATNFEVLKSDAIRNAREFLSER